MCPRILVLVLIGVAALSACQAERRPGGAQSGRRSASGDAATRETADAAAEGDGNDVALADGSACVAACASHELFDRACSCLGVCDRGYLWDGRACLPERDADAGTTSTPDVGVGPDGGLCGDVLEDEDNCGGCGRACAGSCTGGVCTAIGLDWLDSAPTGLRFLRTEVTHEQFAACVRAGPCAGTLNGGGSCNYGTGRPPTLPMNCVDWTGADRFCTWSGGRLPTEDEWYAEASNNGTRDYPWGADPASCARAVMGPNGCSTGGTEPVCSRLSGNSVSGLCDMSGNVWEWTSTQTQGGARRVIRGGGWDDTGQSYLRASARLGNVPANRLSSVGFRCVRPARQ